MLDSRPLFSFWETSPGEKVNDIVGHCRTDSVQYEYRVLLCRNPENRVAKKKGNNLQFSTGYVYFHVLYFFSQSVISVSDRICFYLSSV